MSTVTVTPPAAEGGDLLPLVQATLRQASWHRAFGPTLEARFEADTGQARRRHLVRLGLASLLIYNLFLVNDALTRPEALAAALAYRTGVMGGIGGLVLWLVHRGLPPRWREGLMAAVLVLAMVCSCEIFRATESAAATYDPFLFGLCLLAGNIVVALRFRAAVLTSALGVAVVGAYVIGSTRMPAVAQQFAMALLVGTAAFTCLACYRLESAMRHSYLLLLQESLRSQAALRTADEYARISQTDALTLLPNRRAFDAALLQRWHEGIERRRPLALLLVDVDHFKRYNDRYGHPAGDECLRRVAAAMASVVRQGDILARIGGEEFGLLLADSSASAPARTAERLLAAVRALAVPHADSDAADVVTVSIGLTTTLPSSSESARSLVDQADEVLYEAKRGGRNRWAMAAPGVAA